MAEVEHGDGLVGLRVRLDGIQGKDDPTTTTTTTTTTATTTNCTQSIAETLGMIL